MKAFSCLTVICVAIPQAQVSGDDWPSFRGAAGTGVASSATVPLQWTETKNVLWRVALPDRGNSTRAVWDDRVFVTQSIENDNRRVVICFDANSGAKLWESGVTREEKEPTNAQNPYCASSPATDGERVVAFFGSAGLYCYDFAGNELWHRDFGDIDSWHGSGSSPIIHNGICYLNFGPGTQSALIACDLKNGEEIWRHEPPKDERAPRFGFPRGFRPGPRVGGRRPGNSRPNQEPSDAANEATPFATASRSGDFSGKGGFNGSWSTPVIIQVGDHEELVMVESTRIVSYDPKTGAELWKCDGLPPQTFASPAIGENVIVAMGHATPSGTQIIAVKLGGAGDVSKTHKLWETSLRKECIASGVIANGCVFLVTDMGFTTGLDLATGEKKWEKRIRGKSTTGGVWASLVQINDRLLITNLGGEVFVLAASPDFQLINSNYLADETTCATPAVAGNRLFLRTYDALWCIGANDQIAAADRGDKSMSQEKLQVQALLKSIETGTREPARVIYPKKYIQHNLAVGDGVEGFAAMLQQLPPGSARVNTARVFQDGNFVFAHTEYNFFGPKVGFDVFRFEDGKIVEHWDNLQETPAERNPSGHSMIDGPTEVKDLPKTEENKLLVRQFVVDILVNGNLEKLAGYFDGDNYVQHNPQIGDGLSGLGKALEAMSKSGIVMKYDKVHSVLGEGNFVLVMSDGKFGGKHVAFYDLFRVEKVRIAEHWDTIEPIPPKSEWKNDNGKF